MEEEKKFISVIICDNPKTILLLDSSLSEKERSKRIKKFLDKKGRLKIETVGEHSVYGAK